MDPCKPAAAPACEEFLVRTDFKGPQPRMGGATEFDRTGGNT